MIGNYWPVVYPEAVTPDARAAPQPAAGRDLIEQVLARMRAHGGRATPARRLLLGALVEHPGHHSAEELAAYVQARAPDVHRTTIYRNLEELERLNVVDRTRLGHGPAAYHLASAAHGHLLCERCGSMTEVPDDIFADLTDTARTRYGFTVQPHRFAVIGVCSNCQ
jgi:Fur family transcriptional regulator, ferric uptake regulator